MLLKLIMNKIYIDTALKKIDLKKLAKEKTDLIPIKVI